MDREILEEIIRDPETNPTARCTAIGTLREIAPEPSASGVFADLDELRGLDQVALKKRLSASFPLTGSTPEDRGDRRSPLNVRVHLLQHPVQVAARECLKSSPRQLDVFFHYSDSPAASRASSGVANISSRTALPSRIVQRCAFRRSTAIPLPLPRPTAR
jgi:hypothetical protein